MPNVFSAVQSLVPNAELSIEETYESILWLDDRPQPSKAEVDAELARQQAEWDRTEYQRLRAAEYPPLTDLADAIYWQQQGDDSKMTAYVAACEAVKAKYPKPDDSAGN